MTGARAIAIPILLGAFPALAYADDPLRPGPPSGVQLSYAERQVITPHRSMEIFVEVPVFRTPPDRALAGFQTGARHGIFEDWEIGIMLWPVTFRDGLEAGPPSVFGTYRIVELESFELGASGRLGFPFGPPWWEIDAGLPMLFKLAEGLRLDTGPQYRLITKVRPAYHAGVLPFRLSYQLASMLRVSGTTGLQVTRTGLSVGAGAELAVTIEKEAGGAACDIVVSGALSDLAGTAKDHPRALDTWTAMASLRFFMHFGSSTWEDDGFLR